MSRQTINQTFLKEKEKIMEPIKNFNLFIKNT